MSNKKNSLAVAICPPKDKSKDTDMVNMLLNGADKKVVCGGSTAKVFARIMNKNIEVIISEVRNEIPPKAYIEGLDLVTEGLVTLSAVNKMFENLNLFDLKNDTNPIEYYDEFYDKNKAKKQAGSIIQQIIEQQYHDSPAKDLALELSRADSIQFILGTSINQPDDIEELTNMKLNKQNVISELITQMNKLEKKVYVSQI